MSKALSELEKEARAQFDRVLLARVRSIYHRFVTYELNHLPTLEDSSRELTRMQAAINELLRRGYEYTVDTSGDEHTLVFTLPSHVIRTRDTMNATKEITSLRQVIKVIDETASKELVRPSQARKKTLENMYVSLTSHAHKLGIEVAPLSLYYSPREYQERARDTLTQLEAMLG